MLTGAHRRERALRRSAPADAPDVILVLDPEFEFGTSAVGTVFGARPRAASSAPTATHRPDGILVVGGPGVHAGVDLDHASLLDVPATLMWALGLEVPAAMDGRVVAEAFDDDLLAANPVRVASVDDTAAVATEAVYTADEEEQLAAHLEELGYL